MPESWKWGYSTHYWWHFTVSQRKTAGFPSGICMGRGGSIWLVCKLCGSGIKIRKRNEMMLPWKCLTLQIAKHVIQLCRNCLWSWNCGLHNDSTFHVRTESPGDWPESQLVSYPVWVSAEQNYILSNKSVKGEEATVAGKVKVNERESGHSGTETIYDRCLKETSEGRVRESRKERDGKPIMDIIIEHWFNIPYTGWSQPFAQWHLG